MSEPVPFSGWTVFWLLWAFALLADIIAAKVNKHRTLSEHIWGRWFPEWWARGLFLLFWTVVGVHFATAGAYWWSSGGAVLVAAVPVAVLIVKKEGEMGFLRKLGGWLKGAAGSVWDFTKHHGPLLSSAIMGLSFVFPALGPIATALGGVLGGAAQPNPDLSKAIGELVVGLVGIFGVIRKVLALVQAAQPALPPAK